MSIKVGDTVRYLNSVGGGRVVRIADNIAYVDEDGFETPVLVRECVAVGPTTKLNTPIPAPKAKKEASRPETKVSKVSEAPTLLPIVETASGNTINLVLGFEASDLKSLSSATFDGYIVNDSNYYVFISIGRRSTSAHEWTHVYDGLIEPNIQEFVGEILREDLPDMDRILVQYVAFKRDKTYETRNAGNVEIKVDTTKFAKLHCFRPNQYFEVPVIAFDVVTNDRPVLEQPYEAADIEKAIKQKRRDVGALKPKAPSKSSKPSSDVIVVDLHADELLDDLSGLSTADILNLQIDEFCKVMDANLRKPGQKIVFIHGKGEGVLRHAIMKELSHKYKGHDVQDASFREYGFGATQVTIKASGAKR